MQIAIPVAEERRMISRYFKLINRIRCAPAGSVIVCIPDIIFMTSQKVQYIIFIDSRGKKLGSTPFDHNIRQIMILVKHIASPGIFLSEDMRIIFTIDLYGRLVIMPVAHGRHSQPIRRGLKCIGKVSNIVVIAV